MQLVYIRKARSMVVLLATQALAASLTKLSAVRAHTHIMVAPTTGHKVQCTARTHQTIDYVIMGL
eukprot:14827-Heterococcus_DN1.PRE.2